jgi:hypothetical protein
MMAAKLEKMLQAGPVEIDRRWTAFFGSSPDGLPDGDAPMSG